MRAICQGNSEQEFQVLYAVLTPINYATALLLAYDVKKTY